MGMEEIKGWREKKQRLVNWLKMSTGNMNTGGEKQLLLILELN